VSGGYEVLSGSGSFAARAAAGPGRAAAGDAAQPGNARLQGSLCADAAAAAAAVARGAQFLVLERPLAAATLRRICATANVPVYPCGMSLEEARALGAAGVSELGPV
jgi:hypothetical protein